MSTDIRAVLALPEKWLAESWNKQADEFNQWDSLGLGEQLGWAQVQAVEADRARAALAKPVPGDVERLVRVFRQASDEDPEWGRIDPQWLTNAAALLQQQAARITELEAAVALPAPVPVAERLPGDGDLDQEGTCWVWNYTAYTWGLFRLDPTCHSHWLPCDAIPWPAPQAGEVEG